MVWPTSRLSSPPSVDLPDGYALRQYTRADEECHSQIMELAGWRGWAAEYRERTMQTLLPGGWFLAVHQDTDTPVASAMCCHNYKQETPCWGGVGWVGCDPAHTGRGLGGSVTAAVVARLLDMGYEKIDLYSEDFRLAALKTYLGLGFVPLLYTDDMAARWARICCEVGWPSSPETWPVSEADA